MQLLYVRTDEVAQSGHAERISARVLTRVARIFCPPSSGLTQSVTDGTRWLIRFALKTERAQRQFAECARE
jgi:hypothetical protein